MHWDGIIIHPRRLQSLNKLLVMRFEKPGLGIRIIPLGKGVLLIIMTIAEMIEREIGLMEMDWLRKLLRQMRGRKISLLGHSPISWVGTEMVFVQ
jgi:hypothetical protein